ncbi:hypothetical protein J2T13_002877 [Paenibacillus sp. DS2015]|uniref:RNase A-like domain-containing protein n=1 Tax=Paenibacillus sp. DS2015 TaxID=3373917 RepID=UPI003D217CC0
MLQKVDLGKLLDLEQGMRPLNRKTDEDWISLYKELKSMVDVIRGDYSESSVVQSSVREIESLMQEIHKLSESISNKISNKRSELKNTEAQYRSNEEKLKLSLNKLITVNWKYQIPGQFTGFGSNDGKTPVIDRIKTFLLQIKDSSVVNRLDPFKDDPKISSLLQMLNVGNAQEQKYAREQLDMILKALDEVARSQIAYGIYSRYQNENYMLEAHRYADLQRSELKRLGVSDKYYDGSINLSTHYKGSPLAACSYNPLRTDGSAMPTEGELRMVIAVGMLNEAYRQWAKTNYNQIEASVLKAAEQRKAIQHTLDEYNRTIPREDIEKMQQYLKTLNIYQGEVTGEYDLAFLLAVSGYQHISNTASTRAALWKYTFEVNGKVDKNLLQLAFADSASGYRNNPDLKINPHMTIGAMTLVGVGDGVVSQLVDDGKDIIESVWSTSPANLKFWTETLPETYQLGEAIVKGEITITDIKDSIGEGLAEQFVTPFKDIERLSAKVMSGKATYEESVEYGRALAKAVQVVIIVVAAAKSGAQLAAKTGDKLAKLVPELYKGIEPKGLSTVTPDGVKIKMNDSKVPDIGDLPITDVQKNYIDFYEGKTDKGVTGGRGEIDPDAIRKIDNNILDRMESAGGHTVDRHVSKTNEELIKRAIQEDVEAATSFTDKNTAIKAIQENLRKNAEDIAEWLNESDTGRKMFDVSHKNPVGKGVLEDKKQVIYDLNDSRVVLIRDSTQELGFKILTSFPIIK